MTSYDSELEKQGIEAVQEVLRDKLHIEITKNFGKIPLGEGYIPDAYLEVRIGGEEKYLAIEVKGQIQHLSQIKTFLNFADSFQGMAFLASPAIADSIKRQLTNKGIGYLEFEKELNFPVHLQNFSSVVPISSYGPSEGFRADSTLKVLFYLAASLENQSLTQRQLAETLGLSVGSVNRSLKALEEEKIIERESQSLRLKNTKKVFEYWNSLYWGRARAKLSVGRFSPITPSFYPDWQTYDLKATRSYWGGEPAVRRINDFLTPGFYTIYSYEPRLAAIMASLKLKKDPAGKIEILRSFWPENLNDSYRRTVPPFLILSDLYGSNIDRNIEAAENLLTYSPELRKWK
ncbi:hypothetical protein AZI85_17435 [Bdellovibrio bacteriovorus]|uniref:HTH crp-type domain-containing protein n=1 Tax=Bdellovibrio bacteriovorus TaxID=959 RepID=A0A150WMG1_BDEBC|nr:type IV toxin-antitoxin system AbiEi family antitoxin [Bdellovibrio bacteriovorus]KYG65497.1 hypothetical protein AZI85_17435 [Bdellovibrio bacteriovorus]